MAENSIKMLLLLSSIVLLLSFKDLILIRSDSASPEKQQAQKKLDHSHLDEAQNFDDRDAEEVDERSTGKSSLDDYDETPGEDDFHDDHEDQSDPDHQHHHHHHHHMKSGEDDGYFEEKRIPSLKMMKGGIPQTIMFKFW